MDKEITRLLKLKRIPNFKLSEKEEEILEEWKKAQKPVVIRKPRKKKTTNEVKQSEKETGELEIVIPEES